MIISCNKFCIENFAKAVKIELIKILNYFLILSKSERDIR